jgi:hypothetical protein
MQRAAMSSAASLAPPHFLTLSHKRHDFPEKVIERKMCALVFPTTLKHFSVYEEFSELLS